MATELATAYLSLVPSMRGAEGKITAELAGVGATAGEKASSGFLSKMGGVVGGVAKVTAGAVGLVGGLLGGLAAKGGIERALNIEDAKAKLTGLGHSTETVTGIMQNATASVKGTAFGLGEAATTAAGAVAAGIEPGERLQRVLGLVADSATIAGTDMSSMGSIFNKVAASNKLQGDSIAQLQDAGVPVLQFVAKEMGVTAEEASKMASEGKISFETFANAMESGLGGAALASGNTFRGALKNVYAALGRVGETVIAPFLRTATLAFGAAMPLIDNVNAALKPAMASVEAWLGARAPAMIQSFSDKANVALTGTIQAVTAFVNAWRFNDGEVTSSGLNGWMERFGYAAHQAFDVARTGILAFTNAWKYNDGEVTSSGLNGFLERLGYAAHQAFDAIRAGLSNLWAGLSMDAGVRAEFEGQLSGMVAFGAGIRVVIDGVRDALSGLDFSSWAAFKSSVTEGAGTMGGAFSSIGLSIQALIPAGQAFLGVLPQLTAALPELARGAGELAAVGIQVLAGALSFLAAHVDTIIAWMPLIVAGFVAWKVSSMALHAQATALAWVQAAMTPVMLANNVLRLAAIRLEIQHAAAQGTNTAATNTGMFATIRATAAWVGHTAALAAHKVAAGISAAAQWALNTAMSANPIALIVIAIAALVAGLIWFFTQTELGQQIFQTAWAAIQVAAAAVADWFTTYLVPVLGMVWEAIKVGLGFLFAYYKFIWDTILAVASAVGSWFVGTFLPWISGVWDGISAGFSWLGGILSALFWAYVNLAITVWTAIYNFIAGAVNWIKTAVSTGFNIVLSTAINIFNAVVSFVAGIPGRIMAGLSALGQLAGQALGWFGGVLNAGRDKLGELTSWVGGLPGRIVSALGNLGSLLYNAGRDVVNGMINGIRDMVGGLASTAADMAKSALSAAKNAIGIKSPSKAFRLEVGRMAGEGYALGLEDMQARADAAATALTALPDVPAFASSGALALYAAAANYPAGSGAAGSGSAIPPLTIEGDVYGAIPEEIVDEINTTWARGAVTYGLRGIGAGV